MDTIEDSQTEQPANKILITTNDLTKRFGETAVVEKITMDIPQNSIFGFIGPSGSGKTTTMRLLLGLYAPTEGEARIFDKLPAKFSRTDREQIGYMPQHFVLYPDLSVWENLNFVASIYGLSLRRQKRMQALLDLVELNGHERKLARDISGGMQRRLSLAATLLHQPQVIFLDEPTAGIDPVLRRKLWDHFEQLKEEGRTLFITTQYVGEAAYCDYVGVMSNGRLLMVETPENLRRRALGGDILHVATDPILTRQQVNDLRQHEAVKNGRVAVLPTQEMQITVDDAKAAMPHILNWIEEQGITIKSAGEHLPPFDDIFVKLVQTETAQEEAKGEQ